jgi:hypothetical protein
VIRVLVVIGAALTLATPLAQAADREVLTEQSERVLDAGGLSRLEVANARGLISVRRGAEGRIRLTALKIVTRGDREHARELADATLVRTTVEGGRLDVRVEYPQHRQIRIGFWDLFCGRETPQVEVRLAFEVPRSLAVSLKSSSGDLTTAQLAGDQTLESTSGEIEVGDASAPVKVSTVSGDVSLTDVARGRVSSVSGDIQVERVGGTLKVTTTSGDVNVRGAGDSLTVTSVSGEIQVDGARRGLAARTTSGDVEVRGSGRFAVETASGDATVSVEAPFGGAQVATVSGDIRLHLGGVLGCALEARTASGTIDLLVPLEVRTVSRQRVAGVVRHGTAPVVLRSSSGDVHVQN